jgi:hypothetical protein
MNASFGVATASFTTDGKVSAGAEVTEFFSFSNLKVKLQAFLEATFDTKKALDETSKIVVDIETSIKGTLN